MQTESIKQAVIFSLNITAYIHLSDHAKQQSM